MFFVFAALSVLAGIAVLLSVPRDTRDPEADKRIDWGGAVLITTSLVLLLYVLASGEVASHGWATPREQFSRSALPRCLPRRACRHHRVIDPFSCWAGLLRRLGAPFGGSDDVPALDPSLAV